MQVTQVRPFKIKYFHCFKFPREVFFAQVLLKFTQLAIICVRISARLFMLRQASPRFHFFAALHRREQ